MKVTFVMLRYMCMLKSKPKCSIEHNIYVELFQWNQINWGHNTLDLERYYQFQGNGNWVSTMAPLGLFCNTYNWIQPVYTKCQWTIQCEKDRTSSTWKSSCNIPVIQSLIIMYRSKNVTAYKNATAFWMLLDKLTCVACILHNSALAWKPKYRDTAAYSFSVGM